VTKDGDGEERPRATAIADGLADWARDENWGFGFDFSL
jgi:hypothetical protein